jgi:ABC-2 type transport system permease protein
LVLCALPFGLTIEPVGLIVVLALVGLIGLTMASISYIAALSLKDENSYAPLVFTATLPLLLLSGVLLPLSLAPDWLRTIATFNPLSHAVDAARAIFLNHLSDSSVPLGVGLMGGLAAIAVVFAARSFGRAVA